MIVLDIDPNVVKPGWTPLIITILLAAAIALLMISMRRQMRKVRAPYRDEIEQDRIAGTDDGAETDSADADPAATESDAQDSADEEQRHPIGNSG